MSTTYTTIIFESAYTGHRREHISHLMHFINQDPSLHHKYVFILNNNMKVLLNELADSGNYDVIFFDFNKSHANSFTRSFWECSIIKSFLIKNKGIKEMIFMDIDPYLFLLTLPRFKRFNLKVKGTLFQPYIHFNENKKGIIFYLKKTGKNFLLQKSAVLFNNEVRKIFILNDLEGVGLLNKKIKNIFTFLPDPIFVSSNHIEPSICQQISKRYNLLSGKKVLLIFGRIDERKNLVNIIDGVSLLPQNLLDNTRLIIAGEFLPHVKDLYLKHIEKYKNKIDISVKNGFVADIEMEILFQKSDVILMPYINFFSSSGIIGHAIKYNKNVVVSQKGLVEKIVVQNNLGVAVDPYNPSDISEAINKILSNKTLFQYDSSKFLETYNPQNFSRVILLS